MPRPKRFIFGVSFPIPPALGTEITTKGQSFVLCGWKDHTRADGFLSHVLTWESECEKCGQVYRASTGKSFTSIRKRCTECKPPVPR